MENGSSIKALWETFWSTLIRDGSVNSYQPMTTVEIEDTIEYRVDSSAKAWKIEAEQPPKHMMRIKRSCSLHKTANYDDSKCRSRHKKTPQGNTAHDRTVATSSEPRSTPTQDESETDYVSSSSTDFAIGQVDHHPSSSKTKGHLMVDLQN